MCLHLFTCVWVRVCVKVHIHMCAHVCGGKRLLLGISLDHSSIGPFVPTWWCCSGRLWLDSGASLGWGLLEGGSWALQPTPTSCSFLSSFWQSIVWPINPPNMMAYTLEFWVRKSSLLLNCFVGEFYHSNMEKDTKPESVSMVLKRRHTDSTYEPMRILLLGASPGGVIVSPVWAASMSTVT